ncbi:hypothetical protein SDC9_175529 [bioreactor metagenome]|uniref:Uncharacterized protein n=1 Tax=bioreactor metagenome TaxID=1076179 RepID=A0A645GPF5_9ZZZZ
MKRKVDPDSPQSISLEEPCRFPPSILKADLPGYKEDTGVILTPSARKARQVASISAEILILSTTEIPSAKAAHIISLCPMLFEEGTLISPASGTGLILIVSITFSYQI